MLLVRTVRKSSRIHGLGLFADQFVPAGAPTWRFTPGVDTALHPDLLDRIPETALQTFLTYAYLDIRTGLYVLCADDARFMNHSTDPAVRQDYDQEPVFGLDVATRDLQPGDELTCDYTTFDRVDREALHFGTANG